MSVHLQWRLICQLFATGRPVRFQSLTPTERTLLPSLGQAIKQAVVGSSDVLCPYCDQHSVLVMADAQGGRQGYCPDCGQVGLQPEDFRAYVLDDSWMQRNLRLALDIQSRDGVDELADGVWRLGDARRSPVVLARNLTTVWRDPSVLDRVRIAGVNIRLITPVRRDVRGLPLGYGVDWLPLEDRFVLYGGGISAVGEAPEGSLTPLLEPAVSSDPSSPVHGPFSMDFRWVTVPEIQEEPIGLTKTQAAIFEALWSFKGQPRTGEQIMARAGSKSAKPGDLFKDKRYELVKRVFGVLVQVKGHEGLYAMACAKRAAA